MTTHDDLLRRAVRQLDDDELLDELSTFEGATRRTTSADAWRYLHFLEDELREPWPAIEAAPIEVIEDLAERQGAYAAETCPAPHPVLVAHYGRAGHWHRGHDIDCTGCGAVKPQPRSLAEVA